MEHLILKAATTATTDLGEFTAIAAAYTVDRVNDRIIPGAFAKTIQQWQASGKRVPLHWNHEGDAKSIIGFIDPATMVETDAGLQVSGKVDLADSDIAREAWRSMKNGSMSLSFGYLTTRQRKGADGVNELHELDLFEVSIVPIPANPDTRILSLKSADAAEITKELQALKEQVAQTQAELEALKEKSVDETDKETKSRSVDPLRQQAEALALEVASDGLSLRKPPAPVKKTAPPELIPLDELKARSRDLMLQVLSGIEET